MPHRTIDAAKLRTLIDGDTELLLLDVRTPREFQSEHIAGSVNVPLDQIDGNLDSSAANGETGLLRMLAQDGRRTVLVCRSGRRAVDCSDRLARAGIEDTDVLEGGLQAWNRAGGDVERGRGGAWDLERQVRFTAGAIVLSSVLAGIAWPPAFALAGLIGAGLVFSAITDTCGMGMVLARMPWNKSAPACPTLQTPAEGTGTAR
ncbi:rhodanese-like domain-containing protein [Salininema proteolyticum]|uniref:Rhodanese-like domain-containing protein n=1 Tax=Salininema proteolyticum TaxID=1607685 RepID=A0ABV8TX02_9ACTN